MFRKWLCKKLGHKKWEPLFENDGQGLTKYCKRCHCKITN